MIAYLTGQLFRKTTQSVIIEAGGIGYEVFVPLSTFYTLPEKDEKVSLHIYNHVREDALLLFGFQTKLEKDLFLMLISVSGIGPKLSVNILSGIGPQELLGAIASGDTVRLRAIPGVGKKTAERIALELKDRACKLLDKEEVALPPALEGEEKGLVDDALSALLNLGYSPKAAKMAIEKARPLIKEMTLEGLIREALKVLA
ncbi:MAG: Holliday junction branch migration protein RuvA [Desulfobacteraceae bacterium]|nr:MAG: Holliday junction branch migration protein RuvA [Desulfobacteraceae bacterium]